MRKLLKYLGVTLLSIIVLLGLFLGYVAYTGIPTYEVEKRDLKVEITPKRIAQGYKIASMECIACHVNDKGSLTGRYLKELPKEFGTIYSRNITQDPKSGIGAWTDGELYTLLRTGVGKNGQYIPPYMAKFPLACDEDLYSVIAWLRSNNSYTAANAEETPPSSPSLLTKVLSRFAFKPLAMPTAPIPEPDTNNAVAHGKYLATAVYGCYACHSADFKTLNESEPEKSGGFFGGGNVMTDMDGNPVVTSNLTFDATGLAQCTEAQFIAAVRYGKSRNGGTLRYPMFPHVQLTDKEVSAIYAYLKTVPKIANTPKVQ